MFSQTEVSFTIHRGKQSLIMANNVIVVCYGFIYICYSFSRKEKACIAVGGEESHLCFHFLLLIRL